MAIIYIGDGKYIGLSADVKPTTGVTVNSIFKETDTRRWFIFNGTLWNLFDVSSARPIIYGDQNNNFGAFYQDIGEIASPSSPAANVGRLFFDMADEHFKIKKSDGTVKDFEAAASGAGIQKGGIVQFSGTGAQTVFTITHELGVTPDFISVEAGSDDARGEFTRTKDATNITITYAIAPPSGTNNVKFEWGAASTNAAVPGFTATSLNTLENKTYQNALFNTYTDFVEQASAPADPSANRSRIYMKEIDANNEGLFARVRKNGGFVEVQIF
jgi:hypothetical protein